MAKRLVKISIKLYLFQCCFRSARPEHFTDACRKMDTKNK